MHLPVYMRVSHDPVYADLINGTYPIRIRTIGLSGDGWGRGYLLANVVNDFSRHPKECCGGRVECV